MKKNMLSALVMGLFLVGCTVKKDAASNAEALSELGNWSTDCIVNESDSSLTVYEMENGTMTTAHYMYQNSVTCDAAQLSFVLMQYGPYAVTGDHATIPNGKNFSQQIQAFYIIPQNSTAAAQLNGDSFCGYTDWSAGEAKFGFGCDEGNAIDAVNLTYNSNHYGVFAIENSATPSIQFGSECQVAGYVGLCPTEQDRSSSLDEALNFKR